MPDQIVHSPGASGPLSSVGAVRVRELLLAPKERLAAFDTATAESSPPLGLGRFIDALVAPLSVDGSAVWVQNPDPDLYHSRWAEEHVTAVLGPLPDAIAVPQGVRRLE